MSDEKPIVVQGTVNLTSDNVFNKSTSDMCYEKSEIVKTIMGDFDGSKHASNAKPIDFTYKGGLLQKGDQLEFLYREEDLKTEKIIKVTGNLKTFMSYSNNGQGTSVSDIYGLILDNCRSDGGLTYTKNDNIDMCKSDTDNANQKKSLGTYKVFYFNRIVRTSLKAVRNDKRILLPGNYVNLNIKAGDSFLNTDALIKNISKESINIAPILYEINQSNKTVIVSTFENYLNITEYENTDELILNIILKDDKILENNINLKDINSSINQYFYKEFKIIPITSDIIEKNFLENNNDDDLDNEIDSNYLFNKEQSKKYKNKQNSQKDSTNTPSTIDKVQTTEEKLTAEQYNKLAAEQKLAVEKSVQDAKAQQEKELTNNLALVAKSDDSVANELINEITKTAFKIVVPPETTNTIKEAIKELLPDYKFQFTNNETLKALPENLANFYVQQFEKMSSIYAETEKDLLLWSDEKTTNANDKLFSQLKYINKVDKLHTDLFGEDKTQKLTPSQINFFLSLKDNTSNKLIEFIKARWNDEIDDKERNYNAEIKKDKSKLLIDETNGFFKALQNIDKKYVTFNNNLTNALFITFSYFQIDKNGIEKRDRSSSGVGKIIRYSHNQGERPSEMILLLPDGTLKSTYKLNEEYSKTFTINIRDKDDGIELYWAPNITRRVFAPFSKTKRFLGKTGKAVRKGITYDNIKKGISKIIPFSSKKGGTLKKYPHKITKKNRK